MLIRRLSRELLRKYAKFPALGISVNHKHTYYSDPNAINDLSQQLQERRFLMSRRTEIENEEEEKMKKRRKEKLSLLSTEAPRWYDFNLTTTKEIIEHKQKELRKRDQKFESDRHNTLGYDLAAAHFVLYRGGKIRFKGQSDWILPKKYGNLNLPKKYHPDYLVEALDLSETEFEYEGLLNISSLMYLKWLSFRGSLTINDWCLDRISAEYPSLEYLDISECKNVSERGLEALYRMPNLKSLIVTNHYNSPTFELMCYMLEDVNPYLECKITNLEKSPVETKPAM